MLRFEILLPLYYNDGRQVEQEKFTQTDEEFVAHFGVTSTDTVQEDIWITAQQINVI